MYKKKEGIEKVCAYCGTAFLSYRTDNRFCHKNCASTYNFYERKGRLEEILNRVKDKKPTKTCMKCNLEKPIKSFYSYKKGTFSFCIPCHNENYKDRYNKKIREISNANLSVYPEIDDFVMRIKQQGYNASFLDIFILIDLFDRIFPQANIPFEGSGEKSFERMFMNICKWYMKERKKIYMNL